MLFQMLANARALWTIGGESHSVIEASPTLRPLARSVASHRLTPDEVDAEDLARLRVGFGAGLRDRTGAFLVERPAHERPDAVRLLEKTPRNALRLPMLQMLWPDARVVVLVRDPRQNIASLLEAWRTWRGMRLPGWSRGLWKGLLPPGWQALDGRPIAEVAAFQWSAANRTIIDDLAAWPRDRWCVLDYTELLRYPERQIRRVCRRCGVPVDDGLARALREPIPVSRSAISPPAPDKWRRHQSVLEPLMPRVLPLWDELRTLIR
ncbi:MAG: sulfotransferase [Proteobacteria bacterium]|nr:sulfotransferase [Pseudomonadota bacterium]